MKKVLVTGGMGFIGRYVVEKVQDHGYEPVIFDHHRRNPDEYDPNIEVFFGDVRDDVAVTEAMAHVDGWIHLAAVLGTQETIDNPRPAASSNFMGGLNMLEAAAQYDVPGVYICVGNHWMNNPYSISKTAVERFCFMFNKDRGTRVNMVRAMNAYGPRQLAAAPFGPGKVRKITPALACRALVNAPVELYGGGSQISDMVHVRDVAEAMVRALEKADKGVVFDRVVEVGPENHKTVREVAELIIDLANSNSEIVALPMRPGEIEGDNVVADVSTLALVDLEPRDLRPLHSGMAETVDYFRGYLRDNGWKVNR
jgi:UDP-glucose 4-epimerase